MLPLGLAPALSRAKTQLRYFPLTAVKRGVWAFTSRLSTSAP
uniref:Uncharacterized protein n=1 Tax=Anguilla anguilla TaxID=7936 RepID=A0A0E9U6G9_ANGAN